MRILSSIFPNIFSQSQPDKQASAVVGASIGASVYDTYAETLAWIQDTEDKLPGGEQFEITPAMREKAYHKDPMLSGTITLFLKNIILNSYSVQTGDNKKYETLIKEIDAFLSDIALMDVFRNDFQDYAIVHGCSYRRKDYEDQYVNRLQRLEPAAIATYTDPWDDSIVAYHQKIYVNDAWSESATSEEYNSWFIPGGKKYIENGYAETGAKAIFDEIAEKYNIIDTNNLRVDSADKIIAMHRIQLGDPAPIDSVILAIWLKRLLLTNSPNIIFRILSPFLQVKNGVLLEVTEDGQKQLISSVPPQPPAGMATTDPEQYSAMTAEHNNWVQGIKDTIKNVQECLKEGGVFGSGPDTELNVIESARNVTSDFIREMVNLLDEEIGNAFGFPVSLIRARGAELATTRTIQDIFNTTYMGVRRDYQSVADTLIKERFAEGSWEYEIVNKDGQTERGTFTFEEAAPRFILDTGDVKDALKMAQTQLTHAKKLTAIKSIGASRSDIQALAEEDGFGVLDLERFENAQPAPSKFGSMVRSTDKVEEEKLKEDLLKAYKDAQKTIEELMV